MEVYAIGDVPLVFGQNATERLRITAAAATLTVPLNGVTITAGAASGFTTLAGTGAISGFTSATLTGKIQTTLTTEQLRLAYDGSNYLPVTISSAGRATFSATGSSTGFIFENLAAAATVSTLYIHHPATSGDNVFATFATEGAATDRGSIDYNRAGGLVRYNTTSDHRMKVLYGRFGDARRIVECVPVYLGRMKDATQKRPMFVAHEVQRRAPWAVSGRKNGKRMQQLDQSALMPIAWAAIQDLQRRVAAMEN